MISGRSCRVLVAMVPLLAPMAAFADTLSWSILANTGSYSYAGGPASLIGAGIGVQSVQDTTTGSIFNILNGALSFTTGASSGLWSWGTGGKLSLTGCIDHVTVAGTCTSSDSAVLFSDDFTSAQIFVFGPNYKVDLGNITGTLNSILAQQFGVSAAISSALYNTTVDISAGFGSAFSGGVNLGGTINANAVNVPEDWGVFQSLVILALPLVALGTIRLRVLDTRRRARRLFV